MVKFIDEHRGEHGVEPICPRHGPRTMYGWLPRDKGVCDLRQLVGCGHVFGVSIAVGPRALMNVRVRPGSLSMARALGAPVRTGCPGLVSVSLPSSHFALVLSVRPPPARSSCPYAARQASPVLSIAQICRAMRLASAMATTFSGFFASMRPSQSSPGSARLRVEITPMAPR